MFLIKFDYIIFDEIISLRTINQVLGGFFQIIYTMGCFDWKNNSLEENVKQSIKLNELIKKKK